MGGFPEYFDIILFAMIAVFLVLRLRSVLGRRTGNERRREWMTRRPGPAPDPGSAVAERARAAMFPALAASPAESVSQGLNQIHQADAGFDPRQFLDGAQAAFKMIVTAFARGDKTGLQPLLSEDVFRQFAAAIDERESARETLDTRIRRIVSADITAAGLQGSTAQVTVRLVSEQVHVLRAMDGSVVDGDPDNPIEKTDDWTFARDTRSADPNWVLVATDSG